MKLRCKFCGEYVEREDAYRRGISSFCSEDHAMGHLNKLNTQKKSFQRKQVTGPTAETRQNVLLCDRFSCRGCGKVGGIPASNLHIHHIIYRSQGGGHEVDNLITLCNKCHELVHSDKKRFQPILHKLVWVRKDEDKYHTIEDFDVGTI